MTVPVPVTRVLFVCLGNICRSPAAQGVFEAACVKYNWVGKTSADSAGTGGWHTGQLPDVRMREHGKRRGYDLTHRARQFSAADFGAFDLIFTMDGQNYRDVIAMAPDQTSRANVEPYHWLLEMTRFSGKFAKIPDPFSEGPESFETVLDLVEAGSRALLRRLGAEVPHGAA